MQAIRVDPAAPSGVSLGDAPDPAPRPDEALVAVELFTIVARNFDHAARLPVGSVPGFDTVGVIVRAADDGSGPPVGTRVASAVTGNAWAALRAVPTSELAVVPTGVDPGLASALVVPGVPLGAPRPVISLRRPDPPESPIGSIGADRHESKGGTWWLVTRLRACPCPSPRRCSTTTWTRSVLDRSFVGSER